MSTIVGILTFMSRKNSILGLSKPKNAEFLDIFILMSILKDKVHEGTKSALLQKLMKFSNNVCVCLR